MAFKFYFAFGVVGRQLLEEGAVVACFCSR